jgi:hypothetical protein
MRTAMAQEKIKMRCKERYLSVVGRSWQQLQAPVHPSTLRQQHTRTPSTLQLHLLPLLLRLRAALGADLCHCYAQTVLHPLSVD